MAAALLLLLVAVCSSPSVSLASDYAYVQAQSDSMGVRLITNIPCSSSNALQVINRLAQLSSENAGNTGSLQAAGYNAVVRLYALSTSSSLLSSPDDIWRTRFIVVTCVFGVSMLVLLGGLACIALGRWQLGRRQPPVYGQFMLDSKGKAADDQSPMQTHDGNPLDSNASISTTQPLAQPVDRMRRQWGPSMDHTPLVQRQGPEPISPSHGMDLRGSGHMAQQFLEEDSLFGSVDAPVQNRPRFNFGSTAHSSADSTLATCEKTDGTSEGRVMRSHIISTLSPSVDNAGANASSTKEQTDAEQPKDASARGAAISEPQSSAQSQAAMRLPPTMIHSSIPTGLPEDMQQCWVDFLNLWNGTQEAPWLRPPSLDTHSPQERQTSHSACGAQTSSESEHLLNSHSMASLATLLARHPAWEIPSSDLALDRDAGGQPVVIAKHERYITYRAMLNGKTPVLVQAPDCPTDSFRGDTLAEVSVQLKELNSCPYLPHFHGMVLADKPFLVLEHVGATVRHTITEEAEAPFWYGDGKQTLGALTTDRVALDRDGRPRFTGAGINLLLLRSGRFRRQDLCPLDYTPPEVLLGQRCTSAADIFQYAILVWELITRDLPIRGAVREVLVPDECPPIIAGLLAGCMARNAAHRPTTSQVIFTIQECWDYQPPPIATTPHSMSQASSWPWATLGDQLLATGRSSSIGICEGIPSPLMNSLTDLTNREGLEANRRSSSLNSAVPNTQHRESMPWMSRLQGPASSLPSALPAMDRFQVAKPLFAASLTRIPSPWARRSSGVITDPFPATRNNALSRGGMSNLAKNSSSEDRSDSGASQTVSRRGGANQSQRTSLLAPRAASGKGRHMRTSFGGVGLMGRASDTRSQAGPMDNLAIREGASDNLATVMSTMSEALSAGHQEGNKGSQRSPAGGNKEQATVELASRQTGPGSSH
ncbi:hypothetical protein WJX73_006238 [Symbiochloris irregularis]|uniref:Serine-threonine/tyrosine-protein kinase catalytic domain-containing protein n=1 Tax=Symbiochloris irregularis TaxID=706552 RepID=A0AAW1P2S6_9CHLO